MPTKKYKRNRKYSKTKKRGGVGPDELIKGQKYTTISQNGNIFKGTFNDSFSNDQNPDDHQLIFNDIDYITGHKAERHVVPKSFIQGIVPEEGNVAYGIGYYKYNSYLEFGGGIQSNPFYPIKYEPIIVPKNITEENLDLFLESYIGTINNRLNKNEPHLNINDLYGLPNIRNLDPLYWVAVKGCILLDKNNNVLLSPPSGKSAPYQSISLINSLTQNIKKSNPNATSYEQNFIDKNMEIFNKINEEYPGLIKIPELVTIGIAVDKYNNQEKSRVPLIVSKDISLKQLTRVIALCNRYWNSNETTAIIELNDIINKLDIFKNKDVNAVSQTLSDIMNLTKAGLRQLKDGKDFIKVGLPNTY
jgi:hypothetical protein